jgi:uncharacterized protein YgiB involved in biofilm formation
MAKSPPRKPEKTVTRSGFGDIGEGAPGNATGPRNSRTSGGSKPTGKPKPPPASGMKRSHKIMLGATGIILAGAWLGSGNEKVSAPSDPGADARIYTNLDECMKANRGFAAPKFVNGQLIEVKSSEQSKCEEDFRVATENHEKIAPKFAKQAECETQYGAGQCKSTLMNGTSVFLPVMAGVMVANYLSNRHNAQALLPARQAGAVPCPPGVTPVQQPGCLMPRQASSSSGRTSYWHSYSTSSGHTVSRDMSKPANVSTKVPSAAAGLPSVRTSLGAAPTRSVSTYRSSSSTSRGGFGSTSRSVFRSSSS